MIKFIKNFRKDENGAVTVDWVVLTAAVVALAGVAYQGIREGTSNLSADVNASLTNSTVATAVGGE